MEPRERVREILLLKGHNNKWLAGRIDVLPQNLSGMLNNHRSLTTEILLKISRVFGVPFELLESGIGYDEYVQRLKSGTTNIKVSGGVSAANVSLPYASASASDHSAEESSVPYANLEVLQLRIEYMERELQLKDEMIAMLKQLVQGKA